ncbi:MAG: tRNA (uridine(54)-C5)-methyltransferase TrmA [Saccharospirillaceae bacterium]|nr:tRNA (uridine(54)-C5)-methyltransferase TrmA [Pseudomonadales bacterium]NRB79330.1 tRNA (uridine(54)-C5)-methyltransferase TrmA [Saccharospirillaceae bacterium]
MSDSHFIGKARPEIYDEQIQAKQTRLTEQFSRFNPPQLEVFASEASNFRYRAEFKIWHDGDRSFYAMFDPLEPRTPVEITDFSIGSTLITQLMPKLLEQIHLFPELRNRLFQIEFLTTLKGQALVTLIYHRKLDEQWEQCAQKLEPLLNIQVIGRSRKQRIVLSKEYIEESFEVQGKTFEYRQYENGFTQPNAKLCQIMLNWAVEQTKDRSDDLLELYCGNGNFTLPFSLNFKQVLGTEISKTSVKAANENIELNKLDNVFIYKMSAEDFSNALLPNATGLARKVDEATISRRIKRMDLSQFNFKSVFVDPPRAGLDVDSVELVRQFDCILYVSCNPDTLEQNIDLLSDTHKVVSFAMFDQFPYTHHVETAVKLVRK